MRIAEPDFASGDRVRLFKLEDSFLSGLEAANELVSLIGREWIVDDWHPSTQRVEITCWVQDATGALSHSIWVPPDWIERIE